LKLGNFGEPWVPILFFLKRPYKFPDPKGRGSGFPKTFPEFWEIKVKIK